MNVKCWTLALAAVLSWPASAAEVSYRVAATIVTESGERLTLVEGADGQQRLLRPGDRLGEGRIIEIVERHIRLGDGEREWLVSLEGLGDAPPTSPPPGSVTVGTRELSRELQDGLAKIAAKPKDAVPLTELLGLPAGARVRQVDTHLVQEPQAVAQAILKAVEAGRIPHLFLERAPGTDEIYLVPPSAPENP